jgi:hypothetical protein
VKEKLGEFSANQAETRKSNKGTEQVDPIGTLDLESHLRPDLKVSVTVDEEDRGAERDPGSGPIERCLVPARWLSDLEKEVAIGIQRPVFVGFGNVGGQRAEDPIRQVNLHPASIRSRRRNGSDPITDAVVNVTSQDVGQGRVFDRLPVNLPAVGAGALDLRAQLLRDEGLIEAGRHVLGHRGQDSDARVSKFRIAVDFRITGPESSPVNRI